MVVVVTECDAKMKNHSIGIWQLPVTGFSFSFCPVEALASTVFVSAAETSVACRRGRKRLMNCGGH